MSGPPLPLFSKAFVLQTDGAHEKHLEDGVDDQLWVERAQKVDVRSVLSITLHLRASLVLSQPGHGTENQIQRGCARRGPWHSEHDGDARGIFCDDAGESLAYEAGRDPLRRACRRAGYSCWIEVVTAT